MMEVCEVDYETYRSLVKPKLVYNRADFNDLNKYKVEQVIYLIFRDNKNRFAICLGQSDDGVSCPFSAPFGTFVSLKKKWELKKLEDAVCAFDDWLVSKELHYAKITLPPHIYDDKLVASLQNVLLRRGYELEHEDLNYAIAIKNVTAEDYWQSLTPAGRKNLAIAKAKGLQLHHCKSEEEKKQAYEIIKENRFARGYPLRMSWAQVEDTIKLVPHDFFLVGDGDGNLMAAAQVFQVSSKIMQVVYWGDRPGFHEYKPVNFLAYGLAIHYGSLGLDYLDIGPSTENGVPNYGLCDFKDSIGCTLSIKSSYRKRK